MPVTWPPNPPRALTAKSAAALVTASIAAFLVSAALTAAVAHAASTAPWWRLDSTVASTPELLPEAQVVVSATNLGDGEINGSETPAVFTDTLPEGVTPLTVEGLVAGDDGLGAAEKISSDCAIAAQTVTCRYPGTLAPYERLVMRITVHVQLLASPSEENLLSVSGANAPAISLRRPLHINQAAPPTLGVEAYELTPEGEEGAGEMQSGSHPFQLTTTLDFNQSLRRYAPGGGHPEEVLPSSAAALPRSLQIKLPPGLLADASAAAQCSQADFSALVPNKLNLCPQDTAIGVASVTVNLAHVPIVGWSQLMVPVFNIAPSLGEPARFGFEVEGVPVVIRTALPAGGDYAAEARIEEISQAAQIISSQVTLWGVPGDPRHDSARGWDCLGGGNWVEHQVPCPGEEGQGQTPLLTLPTSCAQQAPSALEGESWPFKENGVQTNTSFTAQAGGESPTQMTGCPGLPFAPSIAVQPEETSASTPTGLNVTVKMPQAGLLSSGDLAEPALRDATVTLPPGLQINPSAANALQDCSSREFGFLNQYGHPFEGPEEPLQTNDETFESPFVTEEPGCPDAAKLGTVTVQTPLLPEELTGSAYLAAQDTSPFRSPLVLYLIAEDRSAGVRIKLAGEASINEQTGQLSTTFRNTPQAGLFTQLQLHLFAGQRASLSTPPLCGSYTTESSFVPWSGVMPVTPGAGFTISSGPGGAPCPPSPLSFAPSVIAGSSTAQAGAFSSFTIQVQRPDGQQQLTGITVHMPPGIAGLLSKLTPCPEPPAGQEWSCGSVSVIGDTTALAGLGSEPFTLPGKAYLTTGYDGAPFGVLVQTPAVAGPFNLGMVNVRSRIEVNPETADVTITTDPGPRGEGIPSRLKGVPAQLQRVVVNVDRPEFLFNPTNCAPFIITGSLSGDEGASSPFSYPFQVSNCATLPFHPTLEASTSGQASKFDGASLTVKVTSQGLGVANIAKTKLTLPIALPSRLSTIQKACVDSVFLSTPSDPGSACDEGSLIGEGIAHTPVLKSPLRGPAYLVSHGGAAFPDVEFVLKGEGILLVLDGKTDITKGITTSEFDSVPDAPVETFEAILPTGPHSALGAYASEKNPYDFCGSNLMMPTIITGQNGAVIEQDTKIAVTGCGAVKSYKATSAQLLAKALKKCRSRYKHSPKKRASCERSARKRYSAKKAAHKPSHRTAARKG